MGQTIKLISVRPNRNSARKLGKWQCVIRSLYNIINNLYDVIHTLPQALYGSTKQMFPQNHEYIVPVKVLLIVLILLVIG